MSKITHQVEQDNHLSRAPTKNVLPVFVISAPGLEQILASELTALGITDGEVIDGGVNLSISIDRLYELNLCLRTASRVTVRVAEFHASSFHELERRAKRIRWSEYLRPGSGVRFRVTCRKSRLYHSDAVGERFAEAVAVQVSGASVSSARLPQSGDADADDVDDEAAQLFIVRLTHDNCVVSADSSGELLHRRGYRQATGKAPLRETLAAAMVIGSGWDSTVPLVDPFCGSGTIPIEAALITRQIPPGMNRSFAFQKWPSYDNAKWTSILERARDRIRPAQSVILGSDRDAGAIQSARSNAERAGVSEFVDFDTQAISSVDFPPAPGAIITNPPYGVRVGDRRALRNLYAQLGTTIRSKARGYTVALLSADAMLEAALGLPLTEVFRARNGGIPVRLIKGSVGGPVS